MLPCRKCGGTERTKKRGCRKCDTARDREKRAEDPAGWRARKNANAALRGDAESLKVRHRHMIRWDKEKGRGTLSIDEYQMLEGRACAYCGFPRPKRGCGLDRKNNDEGHTLENVLPCCAECNYVRSNRFTVDEMLDVLGPALRKIKLDRVTLKGE